MYTYTYIHTYIYIHIYIHIYLYIHSTGAHAKDAGGELNK